MSDNPEALASGTAPETVAAPAAAAPAAAPKKRRQASPTPTPEPTPQPSEDGVQLIDTGVITFSIRTF